MPNQDESGAVAKLGRATMRLLQRVLLTLLCGQAVAMAAERPENFQPPPLWEPPLPAWGSAGAIDYPGGVSYLPDITYKRLAGFRPLTLDLYLPKKSAVPRPLVLWVHGGGFELGNPRADWTRDDWRKVLAQQAARGYVVAGLTYRLSSEATFPAPRQDVQDALRFLRRNARLPGTCRRAARWWR